MTCNNLELEILKAEQITHQINETGEFDSKTALGFLGDFGIGNAMAKSEARTALSARVQTIREAQARNGCTNVAMRPDAQGETTNAATALAAVSPSATNPPAASFAPIERPVAGPVNTTNGHTGATAVATLTTQSPRLYALHLASYRKIESAKNGWQVMLSEHSDLLQGLNPQIARAPDSDFLLLQAGPISNQDEARQLCQLLETRALYCSVVYYEGAPLD